MKELGAVISGMTQKEIVSFEAIGAHTLTLNGQEITLTPEDVEIISEDIPGWQVANDGRLTVALDITVTDELRYEGIAREFVNRIQNIRKENGYDVTDKITVQIGDHEFVREAVKRHAAYIGSQTLATAVKLVSSLAGGEVKEIEIEEVAIKISIQKV
jgi:isoleucyl-tRNA synthetase